MLTLETKIKKLEQQNQKRTDTVVDFVKNSAELMRRAEVDPAGDFLRRQQEVQQEEQAARQAEDQSGPGVLLRQHEDERGVASPDAVQQKTPPVDELHITVEESKPTTVDVKAMGEKVEKMLRQLRKRRRQKGVEKLRVVLHVFRKALQHVEERAKESDVEVSLDQEKCRRLLNVA